ncbi:hypothetical protein [Penaeicola halotolerans]|uniref:hypothetical protein n=1 Tax=Penaeicola halotolerans TaxID=2793196 RepID=UPI001CF84B5A|nr:hypothetical protein [Penaeicola halotolerans]
MDKRLKQLILLSKTSEFVVEKGKDSFGPVKEGESGTIRNVNQMVLEELFGSIKDENEKKELIDGLTTVLKAVTDGRRKRRGRRKKSEIEAAKAAAK